MANSARARSTCAAGALSERLKRVSSWRSSAVSGRRGSFRWRDMGHLGARGSPHHYTRAHGRRPTRRRHRRSAFYAALCATVPASLEREGRLGVAEAVAGVPLAQPFSMAAVAYLGMTTPRNDRPMTDVRARASSLLARDLGAGEAAVIASR